MYQSIKIDGVVDVASTLTTDNWDCLNFFTSFTIVPSVGIEFVNLQYQTRNIKKSENLRFLTIGLFWSVPMCEELEVEFKFQISSEYTNMLEKMGAKQIKVALVYIRQD